MKTKKLKAGNAKDAAPETNGQPKKLSHGDIQKIANRLIREHGSNLPNRADFDEICESNGVKPAQLDGKILAEAERSLSEPLPEAELIWSEPTTEDFASGTTRLDVWRTKDGKYRICRYSGPEPRFACGVFKDDHDTKGKVFANDLKSLSKAFDACDGHIKEFSDAVKVSGNREKILEDAREKGYHRLLPPGQTTEPKPEGEVDSMKVSEKAARNLLVAVGYKNAAGSKCTLKKVHDWVNSIPKVKDEIEKATAEKPLEAAEQKLLDCILTAVEAGKAVEIVEGDAGPSEAVQEPAKAGRGRPKGSKNKEGTPKATKEEKANPEKGSVTRRGHEELFGYSRSKILHWMGANEWSFEDAKKVLDTLKVGGMADSSIKTSLKDGKNPETRKAADLTKDQERQLKQLKKS